MAKHAHSFTEAHEMETLKEGTWYIRGCEELEEYFDKIRGDDCHLGYFIVAGKWDCDDIENFQHRTEITLQDYLDSLKPQSFAELDLEFEEKERSAIEFLKSRGYFVFPKAEEGDFPDLSNWEGVEMEGKFGVNNTFVKSNILLKHGDYFLDYGFNVTDFVRPIQKQKLTLAELAEKAGLDINNIEIIE